VRFLFEIWANYRAVFKVFLNKFKAILKHFKVILKQIKAVNRYKSRGYGIPPLPPLKRLCKMRHKKDSGQAEMRRDGI
jgi:hypothetical protein